MFRWWKRRNDGFEWREYVQTTILLRRGDRRRRVEDVRLAAVDSLKEAGRKGAGVAGAGLSAAGGRLGAGLFWLLALPGRALAAMAPIVGPRLRRLRDEIGFRLEPLLAFLGRREIRFPLIMCGAVAAAGALVRINLHGWDQEVTFAAAIAGVATILAALPALLTGSALWPFSGLGERWKGLGIALPSLRLSGLGHVRAPRGAVLAAAAVAGVVGVSAWYALDPARTGISAGGGSAAVRPGALEGRAVAVSGDRLRIAGSVVRLAGIESPEPDQVCEKASTVRWRCGDAARQALERTLRGQRAECVVSGSSEPYEATCKVQGEDVAGQLVRQGHVFAVSDARYTGIEDAARAARTGLWSGTAERPAAYRAKRWEEAKRSAPEGCPIKGKVSDRGRVYVLPWSPSYDSVKVRAARGERWFCSEEEAQAAGWKATTRS